MVEMGRTQVTARALAKLSALPKLERLSLWRASRITDDAASHLIGMKALKWLDVVETAITPAGAAQLQKQKPGCDVMR